MTVPALAVQPFVDAPGGLTDRREVHRARAGSVARPRRVNVGVAPQATPRRPPARAIERAGLGAVKGGRACSAAVELGQARNEGAAWRLTDRGVAVVLVVSAMIMAAAISVVGLTAMRVTGDGYRADLAQRAHAPVVVWEG